MQRFCPKYKVAVRGLGQRVRHPRGGMWEAGRDSRAVAARLLGTLLQWVGWIGEPGSLSSHPLLESGSLQHPLLSFLLLFVC